jgi:Tol biopolymer transport system component
MRAAMSSVIRGATPVRVAAVIVLLLLAACRREPPPANGPYLNMKVPGARAVLFAPGIVSTGMSERDIAISPYGQEIYWCVSTPGYGYATIVMSRQTNAGWTPPRVATNLSDPSFLYIEPAISPDGKQFFFTKVRPDAAGRFDESDIWVMDRGKAGWEKPRRLDDGVNSDGAEFFPSVMRGGTLYFTREPKDGRNAGIYRSRLVDGKYQPAERLPEQVNGGQARFNAFADRDERFLIVPMQGRADSVGGTDYYVVFRNPDDTWTEPVNLGAEVNTPGSQEYSPYISPDGKYFFFMSSRRAQSPPPRLTYKFFADAGDRPRNGNADVWWIDAAFIEKLRPADTVHMSVLSIEPPQGRK